MGEKIGSMRLDATDATLSGAGAVEEQLATFFDDHYDRMVRLAALVCRRGVPAEDAVQAAMEQAWKRRASLREPHRLRWWLDRIVVREAIRMNRPWWRLHDSRSIDESANLLPDPSREMAPERLALRAAFASLSAQQRAAAALHLHLGYSVDETARLMGAGVETTRSRLRLARQRLRTELAEAE